MMMKLRYGSLKIVFLFGISHFLVGQKSDPTSKRALPPKWEKSATSVFFEDAFREALKGTRSDSQPQKNSRPKLIADPIPNKNIKASKDNWSQLISPETIEDEIKSIKMQTDQFVTTPTKFRSGDYRQARMAFSTAAALFGIIAEYDGQVRWKSQAIIARDLFARSAANAKVGTQQVYNEAKQRKSDLQDLTSGAKLKAKPKSTQMWSDVVDRSPLMQRLELAHRERIKTFTASSASFNQNKTKIKHEAELLAAFANVLMQEGMEKSEEVKYQSFCKMLIGGAAEISSAVENNDFEMTRKAHGIISKACDQCHEVYQ